MCLFKQKHIFALCSWKLKDITVLNNLMDAITLFIHIDNFLTAWLLDIQNQILFL